MVDRVAGLLQAADDERGDLGIIFDDEDAHIQTLREQGAGSKEQERSARAIRGRRFES